jgi:regulator of sigma E protease
VTTLLAFLFVLGVLIFVHELGHFLAARRHGVRVLTFSLGFGPKILKVTRGDTEYCVSAIPLGGYVKMAGENPEDPRSGQPDEFLSKTKWQRFQILFAGPAMNILLAVVVLAFVLAQGTQVPIYLDQPPVVGVIEPDSPAAKGGIQPGDLIRAVNRREVETWEDLLGEVMSSRPGRDLPITVQRADRTLDIVVQPVAEGRHEVGDIGVLPDVGPRVASLFPGDPAERAGVQAGDVVLSVNGERVVFTQQLSDALRRRAGQPIELLVRREGRELRFDMTPEARDGYPTWIGISMREATRPFQPGPLEAIKLSVEQNIEMSGLIFRTLGGLFTGQTSVRQLQGPVGIAQLSGESAEAGFIALLSLMAMLSINLGILNLMPVPVLDGGHILIMLLEGIARRDFSMQVKEKMLLAGFVVLMTLMVTVIYNDLTRISWIERLMPWRN